MKALASAVASFTRSGRSCLRNTRRNIQNWLSDWDMMQHHELPSGWDKDLPTFPGGRQGRGDS